MTKLSEMTEEEWTAWVDGAVDVDGFHLSDDWLTQVEWEPEAPVDPYIYIIGLDPGGTTGVACLRLYAGPEVEDPIKDSKPELGYLHQIADGRYGFKTFFGGSEIAENVIIVSEKWKERNVKGADREPQYIEGGIHMLWGEESVEWQYPDKKELIPDEWLKEQNLWTEGHRHQMDALKHAFAYLRNSGNSATLESLSGKSEETMAQPGDAENAQLGEPQEGAGASNLAEAMQGLAEAVQAATEAMEATPADAAQGEFGEAHSESLEHNGHADTPEDNRERTRREVNGAFAGYNPANEETESATVLYED